MLDKNFTKNWDKLSCASLVCKTGVFPYNHCILTRALLQNTYVRQAIVQCSTSKHKIWVGTFLPTAKVKTGSILEFT